AQVPDQPRRSRFHHRTVLSLAIICVAPGRSPWRGCTDSRVIGAGSNPPPFRESVRDEAGQSLLSPFAGMVDRRARFAILSRRVFWKPSTRSDDPWPSAAIHAWELWGRAWVVSPPRGGRSAIRPPSSVAC